MYIRIDTFNTLLNLKRYYNEANIEDTKINKKL